MRTTSSPTTRCCGPPPLLWARGVDHPFEPSVDGGADSGADTLPVVNFGPGLAYLEAAERALDRAGIAWHTALECPMLTGVQAAVEAGLGVAALHPRNLTGQMMPCEWSDRAPLPAVSEVVRRGRSVEAELVDALATALTELASDGSAAGRRGAKGQPQ